MENTKTRKWIHFNLFDVFVVVFCISFALICFYPLWYVAVVSITPYETFINAKLILLPPLNPDFKYYVGILTSSMFKNSILISVSNTVLGTALTMAVSASMAYGLSKSYIRGMKLFNFLAVVTMFFSGGLIPTYFLYISLGLIKTYWVMVIPGAFNVVQFIIMRNYFTYSVPLELEEAARIDGANDALTFFRIIVPLSAPMIAACSLFIAVGCWNDYYSYLMFCTKTELQPYMWVLRRMLTEHSFLQNVQRGAAAYLNTPNIPAFSLRMATIICAIFPILVVYPFLQKYFAKGILIGAVKG